jgi:beta-lactamase superfamily II metal-dependent hydrolase
MLPGSPVEQAVSFFVRREEEMHHGAHGAAEPQWKIPDSRFKTLAPRKACQKNNKLRSCITETTEKNISAALCELCGLCGESPAGVRLCRAVP